MRIKKYFLIIAFIALASLSVSKISSAQTVDLPKAGLTPESSFYFLDLFAERVGLWFRYSDESRAQRHLGIARERLAEAALLEDNPDAQGKALERYGQSIQEAADLLSNAANSEPGLNTELENLVEEASTLHFTVLEDAYIHAPKQAQSAVEHAIEHADEASSHAVDALEADDQQERLRESLRERSQVLRETMDSHDSSLDDSSDDIEEDDNSVIDDSPEDHELQAEDSEDDSTDDSVDSPEVRR